MSTTTSRFSFHIQPVSEFTYRAEVDLDGEPAFDAEIYAPFLLEEFVVSGQYLRQLERLRKPLEVRAARFDDDYTRIVDCGCNVGLFGLFAEAIVGPVSVTGFDPVHVNLEIAHRNLATIPHALFPIALADEVGTQTLHVMSTTGSSLLTAEKDEWEHDTGREALDVEVPVHTLDGYTLGRVDLIKLDVEGSEADVLRGARELLHRDKPYVICSYEHPSNRMGQLATMLECAGYDWENDTVNKLLTFSPRG